MSFENDFAHRDALLGAALHEFTAHGFGKASLNRILSSAGMSKGQLYHHFASKEGLYLAVVGELVRQQRAHRQARPPLGADIFETLRAQLLAGHAFTVAHPALARFAESLRRELGRPIYARAVAAHRVDDGAGLRGLVAWAHARGDFDDGISLEAAQRLILVCVEQIGALAALDAPGDAAARIDEVVGFLRRGLGR